MLRIESLTLREISLTLKEPFQISSGTTSERRILLVELEAPTALVGWGECTAGELPNYGPETIDTAWLAIREWVAPRVLGQTFAGPEEIYPALDLNFRGHNMAKAAVEMAAWELAARDARGCRSPRSSAAPATASGWASRSASRRARRRWSRRPGRRSSAGYRKIKIKIKPGADVEYVRAVREALGPRRR